MTSSAAPTVTIGVPVYNGERYVGTMLESLLDQTYDDVEIIVSDNASTDGTLDVVRKVVADHPAAADRVVLVTADENLGAAWNFNHTLEMARGRYFKWQAHDDVLEPTYLERCVELLDRDPDGVVAHTAVDFIDADGERTGHYGIRLETEHPDPVHRFREEVLQWNMCYPVFGLMRTDVLRRAGGMPPFSHGDGVLLARMALEGTFPFVDEPLFLARHHEEQSMRQFGYEGGGNDYEAYAAWFDPSLQNRVQLPNWAILREYRRAMLAVQGLGLGDRGRCAVVLVRRYRQDARILLGDLSRWGRRTVASLRGRSSRSPIPPAQRS